LPAGLHEDLDHRHEGPDDEHVRGDPHIFSFQTPRLNTSPSRFALAGRLGAA
jgi:hypothetical protein